MEKKINDTLRYRLPKRIILMFCILIGGIYSCCPYTHVRFQMQGILLFILCVLILKLDIKSKVFLKFFSGLGGISYILYLIKGKLLIILPKYNYPLFNTVAYICMMILCIVIYRKISLLLDNDRNRKTLLG